MADTTTVRVRVTQDDIDAGVRGDCTSCPVARAVARVVPAGWLVDVGLSTVAIFKPGRLLAAMDFHLPDDVVERITRFDEQGEMEPFEFDLPLPTEPEVAASVEGDG